MCQDEDRNYDETKQGAMEGTLTYYHGSELYIEWVGLCDTSWVQRLTSCFSRSPMGPGQVAQHGCGVDQPNVICQMVRKAPAQTSGGFRKASPVIVSLLSVLADSVLGQFFQSDSSRSGAGFSIRFFAFQ